MRTRAVRSTRFSRRQRVGGEASGASGLGGASGGQLQRGVGAEGLVVVEVLVAQGDGDDPLGEHGLLVVDDQSGWRGSGMARVEGVEEAEAVARPRGAAGRRRRW